MSSSNVLQTYFQKYGVENLQSDAIAFYAMIDEINKTLPSTAQSIVQELNDQRTNLKLIASENYSSLATQYAQGNLLTDKYAEGIAGKRFYAGCDNVDDIELEAAKIACELFGSDHAYVQPHSGSDANLLAFLAILTAKIEDPMIEKLGETNPAKINESEWNKIREAFHSQKLFAMDYYSGGHLTHGYRHNYSSILFDVHPYTVEKDTGLIDLDTLRKQLHEIKPLVFLAGYSSYPRKLNFAKMREMADEVGAVFMVDMAHFAGLVAGKVFSGDYDPVKHAHIVTSTTHKTLRGPRGGIVLCTKEFAPHVDRGCPIVLGGPLPHAMAAKAVAFEEAMSDDFKTYAQKIVENSQSLAEACLSESMTVLTGGTDNHMIIIDVAQSFGLTGRQAESVLRECQLTLNRNVVPFDPNGPWYTSGLRLGTPATTTLGMGKNEMAEIAKIVKHILSQTTPDIKQENGKEIKSQAKYKIPDNIKIEAKSRVKNLLETYPLYPSIDMEILKEAGFIK